MCTKCNPNVTPLHHPLLKVETFFPSSNNTSLSRGNNLTRESNMPRDDRRDMYKLYDISGAINPLNKDDMKRLFERKRRAHGKSMKGSKLGLQRSWNAFIERWNREDMRSAIDSRESRYQKHSLVYLRDQVCIMCRDTDRVCRVAIEETCWCTKNVATHEEWEKSMEERPLLEGEQEAVTRYLRALDTARRAHSPAVRPHNRGRGREYRRAIRSEAPTYHSTLNNQAIARDTRDDRYIASSSDSSPEHHGE